MKNCYGNYSEYLTIGRNCNICDQRVECGDKTFHNVFANSAPFVKVTRDEVAQMAKDSGLTDPDLGEFRTDYGNAEIAIFKFVALIEAKVLGRNQ